MNHNEIQLKNIRLLLLDVDGVLTDGSVIYTGGRSETKKFSVRDGLGIRMILRAGINAGIVTGRSGRPLRRRCRELGIDHVYEEVGDKGAVLPGILTDTGTASAEQVAFMADDLPDIPLLKKVGLPIAVADAHPEVLACAAIITRLPGGSGAVREICEALLQAQGRWHKEMARYR